MRRGGEIWPQVQQYYRRDQNMEGPRKHPSNEPQETSVSISGLQRLVPDSNEEDDKSTEVGEEPR